MSNPSDDAQASAVIWTIGGVDPLGVAGVIADSRAANAIDVHCATIVTCVTAQNSLSFNQLKATDIALLEAQWCALLEQTTPVVIKIGLIANAEQAQWLGDKLASYRDSINEQLIVIYDPVLASSSATELVNQQTLEAIKQFVLPQVDLLTPNIDEAQALTGLTLDQPSDLVALTRSLKIEFELSVLVKGGHLAGVSYAYDCYIAKLHQVAPREPATSFVMVSPLLNNRNLRGTGCSLASSIAAWCGKGLTVCDALILAKASINQAIKHALPLGNNRGGVTKLATVTDFDYLPRVLSINNYLDQTDLSVVDPSFASCPLNLGLYPVVNNCDLLGQLLSLGVKTIQLRAKGSVDQEAEQEIESEIVKAIALGRQYQARVFINDYWQLAIKHQAYGVHLGQEDLQLADLDQIKQAGLRLGLSTHGIYEAVVADQLNPSYIALGHIYPTTTKDMPSTPQGLENFAIQVKLFESRRALVAIGGIDLKRVEQVASTGIGSIAVVRAITQASDVAKTTKMLLNQVGAGDD